MMGYLQLLPMSRVKRPLRLLCLVNLCAYRLALSGGLNGSWRFSFKVNY